MVEALIEADSEEEARRDTGLLLAGVHPEIGPRPVLGPGSWAPARYQCEEVFS